jgi:catechol 2,3-dioxygenase-like lactoylglutathione lyase family enzyme
VYRTPTGTFGITTPINGETATFGNGSTFGFAAKSPAEVDAFHAAGIANGGVTCEDPPGPRTNPAFSYYIAYLRDPSGNKICAMCRTAA